jgi:hypothetical protein
MGATSMVLGALCHHAELWRIAILQPGLGQVHAVQQALPARRRAWLLEASCFRSLKSGLSFEVISFGASYATMTAA